MEKKRNMTKIDIPPITRRVWWNLKVKKTWEKRFPRMRKVYGDAELATVLVGMRRVYVYHINSNKFDESYAMLRENGLVFFPTNKGGIYSGFSHKHRPVEKGKPYQLYGAAVKADDLEAGRLFVEYSKVANKTTELGGELLGYPDCDTKFFETIWPDIQDPMFESALNTPGKKKKGDTVTVSCHPYCNQLLRYFGFRITPHLSHSMQCEKTIAWGAEWIKIMSQIDADATEWLVELLSMPLTWNFYKGVAVIDTPIFRGVTNSNVSVDRKIIMNTGWDHTSL